MRRPWTTGDLRYIRNSRDSDAEIARELGRKPNQIRDARWRNHLPLRRTRITIPIPTLAELLLKHRSSRIAADLGVCVETLYLYLKKHGTSVRKIRTDAGLDYQLRGKKK